jgi:REP element-mobilizing transposase RayT
MSRGNAKGLIFLDEQDFARFLEILSATLSRFGVICYAFCLMPNHYHLVLMTPAPNLSAAIKHLNGVYCQWWNFRHGRCGHVVQGRFKAQLVQGDRYLLAVCRYVVLNPVRAGLVSHPSEWRWSSYRASAHIEPPPELIDPSALEGMLAGGPPLPPGSAYRRFVDEGANDIVEIGRVVRDDERYLGEESFLKQERSSAAQLASREIPRREVLAAPSPSLEELIGPARSKHERNFLMWRAAVECGHPTRDIARHVGLHRVTVNAIIRAVQLGRIEAAESGTQPEIDVGAPVALASVTPGGEEHSKDLEDLSN